MNPEDVSPVQAAWGQLVNLIEDWAIEHPGLVKHPRELGKHAAEYVFMELLGIEDDSNLHGE